MQQQLQGPASALYSCLTCHAPSQSVTTCVTVSCMMKLMHMTQSECICTWTSVMALSKLLRASLALDFCILSRLNVGLAQGRRGKQGSGPVYLSCERALWGRSRATTSPVLASACMPSKGNVISWSRLRGHQRAALHHAVLSNVSGEHCCRKPKAGPQRLPKQRLCQCLWLRSSCFGLWSKQILELPRGQTAVK